MQPQARYDALVLERLAAMRAQPRFRSIRRRCLARMARTKTFRSVEEWQCADENLQANAADAWWAIRRDAGALAEAYSLFVPQVLLTLMVRRYDPHPPQGREHDFPLDIWQPRARLGIEDPAAVPVERILHATLRRRGSAAPAQRSGRAQGQSVSLNGLRLLLELPLELPPELRKAFARQARNGVQDDLRDAGLRIPRRVRVKTPPTQLKGVLLTHVRGGEFIRRLRLACKSRGVPVQWRPGRPSLSPGVAGHEAPLSVVRLHLDAPVDVQDRVLLAALDSLANRSLDAMREVGVSLGLRMRPSRIARAASELRVSGHRLGHLGLYAIASRRADEADNAPKGDVQEALAARRVKSQRQQATKRLRDKGFLPAS